MGIQDDLFDLEAVVADDPDAMAIFQRIKLHIIELEKTERTFNDITACVKGVGRLARWAWRISQPEDERNGEERTG